MIVTFRMLRHELVVESFAVKAPNFTVAGGGVLTWPLHVPRP